MTPEPPNVLLDVHLRTCTPTLHGSESSSQQHLAPRVSVHLQQQPVTAQLVILCQSQAGLRVNRAKGLGGREESPFSGALEGVLSHPERQEGESQPKAVHG